MAGWITDTSASTRFPVYTRSNASDVLPDPISPLGATLSWAPGVMEGWRDGNVDNGAFDMAELTAEGINPTCGFFNGFFYVNASVVRVFGERSGAGADGVDAAFFGNRPDTPPYVAQPGSPRRSDGDSPHTSIPNSMRTGTSLPRSVPTAPTSRRSPTRRWSNVRDR